MSEDFLKNKIILHDMEEIYGRNSWEQFQGKSVYVTGAAGMIASYLTMFFIYLNEAHGFSMELYGGIRNQNKARKRFGNYVDKPYFHIISDDVSQPCKLTENMDYVIHAASLASPQYYGKMPVETMIPNVIGTNHLLQYAVDHKVEGFLFLSSGNVYGSVSGVDFVKEDTIGTLDFLSEGNVYAESKRCGEALCKAYAREYGVPAKSVRIHHTYGPTMDIEKDARVFAEFVNNGVQGQDIVMKSDGRAQRAFCYLTDTVTALLTVLLKGKPGESYNVGNPQEHLSIAQLAHLVAEISPKDIQVVIASRQEGDDYRPTTEARSGVVDVGALESLGWQSKVSSRDGFGRCISYFVERK